MRGTQNIASSVRSKPRFPGKALVTSCVHTMQVGAFLFQVQLQGCGVLKGMDTVGSVDFRTQGGFATNHLQCRFELTPENCTTQHQISRGLTELRIRSHSAYIRILLLISAHSLSSAGLDMIAMNTSSKPFEHRNMQCLLASGATP